MHFPIHYCEYVRQYLKDREDEALNWSFDESKTLRIEQHETPYYAEVRFEPTFGFDPRRVRLTIRLRVELRKEGSCSFVPKETEGISLYEGDRLFGEENAWKLSWAQFDIRNGIFDVWLTN